MDLSGSKGVTEITWKEHEQPFHPQFSYEGSWYLHIDIMRLSLDLLLSAIQSFLCNINVSQWSTAEPITGVSPSNTIFLKHNINWMWKVALCRNYDKYWYKEKLYYILNNTCN